MQFFFQTYLPYFFQDVIGKKQYFFWLDISNKYSLFQNASYGRGPPVCCAIYCRPLKSVPYQMNKDLSWQLLKNVCSPSVNGLYDYSTVNSGALCGQIILNGGLMNKTGSFFTYRVIRQAELI